jgi:hypothetical protein
MSAAKTPTAMEKRAQNAKALAPFTLPKLKEKLPLGLQMEINALQVDALYQAGLLPTHADGSVRLARQIPYGSPAWKERYGRRNCAESRNSLLERLEPKRMPVHGLAPGHVTVLQGDFGQPKHPGPAHPRSDRSPLASTA